jgi:hypothetical protein
MTLRHTAREKDPQRSHDDFPSRFLICLFICLSECVAIAADALWIMVRFIRMAAVTNLSLSDFPLMGNVARRAVDGGVGGSKMQLATLRVTRITSG